MVGILVGVATATCDRSVTDTPIPSGPAPAVSISVAFGEAPLEGVLSLSPRAESENWGYAVDLDEDGDPDHEGVLDGEITLAYEFASPGVHVLTVTLRGPLGEATIPVAVIVTDPNAIRVLNQRLIVDPSDAHRTFEGITVDHHGGSIYVGDFWNSQIYRIDPISLQALSDPVQLLPLAGGAEGLSVTPSDSLLIVAHKHHGLSIVAIPSMELRRGMFGGGEYFIHALDDTLAMGAGALGFVLFDTRSGVNLRTIAIQGAWHFAVSSEQGLVAVIGRESTPTLHLISLSTYQEIGQVALPVRDADVVAFDPFEDKAYVMGRGDGDESVFLMVDLASRSVVNSIPLGPGSCGIFCVANPAATSLDGRWVAMEQGGGVYFVDTALDLPRHYIGYRSGLAGMSVTASPVEDAFYLLRSDGWLTKVRLAP